MPSIGQQAGVEQDGGGGADGGDEAIGGCLAADQIDYRGAAAQVFHTRAARKEERVEGRGRRHLGEGRICVHSNAGAARDVNRISECGDGDLHARPAQQVDWGDRFDLFKTFRQDCENRGHGFHFNPMSDLTHRFFAGKRLLVAGCGYVGGAVARTAVERGMKVIALTRNPHKAKALSADGIFAVVADLADEGWHARVPGTVDYVVNAVSSGGGGVEGYRQSYVEGMRSLLRWAAGSEVKTMVYTSSTSVYPQDGGVEVDESAEVGGVGDERTALLVEAESLLRKSSPATRAYVLRLAGIYGPGRHHVLDQVRVGGALPGVGTHRLNLIHRDDAAGAIWAALGAPKGVPGGTYNVADDGPVAKETLAAWLAKQLGLPTPKFDPALPSRRRRSVPDRVIVNARLKRDLGWQPRYPDYRAGYADILGAL